MPFRALIAAQLAEAHERTDCEHQQRRRFMQLLQFLNSKRPERHGSKMDLAPSRR